MTPELRGAIQGIATGDDRSVGWTIRNLLTERLRQPDLGYLLGEEELAALEAGTGAGSEIGGTSDG